MNLNGEAIIAIVGNVLLIATFILGYSQATRTWKRTTTLELLSRVYSDGPVSRAQQTFAIWIANKQTIANDEVSEAEETIIIPMLEFYNFLSISALNGSCELQTIERHRGGAMRATFDLCKEYIKARRRRLNRPKLYSDYEKFVEVYLRSKEL